MDEHAKKKWFYTNVHETDCTHESIYAAAH